MPNERVPVLLLLPVPPDPPTPPALRTALNPPLEAVIAKLNTENKKSAEGRDTPKHSPKFFQLDIALSCPRFSSIEGSGGKIEARKLLDSIQRLLGGVYSLLEAIYTRQGMGANDGLDARFIVIDSESQSHSVPFTSSGEEMVVQTILIPNLQALVNSGRPYKRVYVVESEPGEAPFKKFARLAGGNIAARLAPGWAVERVPGGLQISRKRNEYQPGIGPQWEFKYDGLEHEIYFEAIGVNLDRNGSRLDFKQKLMSSVATFLTSLLSTKDSRKKTIRKIAVGLPKEDYSKEQYDYIYEMVEFVLGIVDFTPHGPGTGSSRSLEFFENFGHPNDFVELLPDLTIEYRERSDPFGLEAWIGSTCFCGISGGLA
jgi:hypothetical protein